MPNVKLTISIDEEIAKDLRARSIEKYGNARSLSQLIEDLATGSAEPAPPVCKIGLISERGKLSLERFNEAVEFVNKQLDTVKIPSGLYYTDGPDQYALSEKFHTSCPDEYFILKEVMEIRLNQIANTICWQCIGLAGPLPTYPTGGHNFEELYMISPNHR